MSFSPSAKNSLYVFSGTLISRILGFIRVILLGTTLGYTRLADSYNLANEIPNIMYELVLGSLIASTMIPFFVQQYKQKDEKADHALISFVAISALGLTVITMLISPYLANGMTILNKTSSAAAQAQLVHFFLLFFLPQIFFYALTAAMQAYLAARSRFVVAAFVPIVNNIVVISMLLLIRSKAHDIQGSLESFHSTPLVYTLAIGTTLGVVLITFILGISYLRAGGRFSFQSLSHPSIRKLISRSQWMVAYAICNQIALFIIVAFANSFEGGVAIYLVAWSFFQLPHGLIANSIMTTMIPRITHTIHFGNTADEFKTTSSTITLTQQSATGLTIIMGAISALFISVATPALVLLIAHGNISIAQGEHTARILIAFVCFLPAFSLYLFCVRMANSLNITKTIFLISVIQNSLNIILALAFRSSWTTVGLALAFSMSYAIAIPLSLKALSRPIGSALLDISTVIIALVVCSVAAVSGYFASISVDNRILGSLSGFVVCLGCLAIGSLFIRKPLTELTRLIYSRHT